MSKIHIREQYIITTNNLIIMNNFMIDKCNHGFYFINNFISYFNILAKMKNTVCMQVLFSSSFSFCFFFFFFPFSPLPLSSFFFLLSPFNLSFFLVIPLSFLTFTHIFLFFFFFSSTKLSFSHSDSISSFFFPHIGRE